METLNAKYSSMSRPVLSFATAYRAMAEQIDLVGLIASKPERYEEFRELVRIAADVYTRRYDGPVVVDGEAVTYGYLQEIFKHLTDEHIQYVLDKLDGYVQEIRYKKAFLRTALCNSVFELHLGIDNQVNADRMRAVK